jgi:uncharacterized membrane protein
MTTGVERRARTTGLTPRAGAVLAYLAWWVTGAAMLLLERRDSYIRFHAAQAFAGLGAVWLAGLLVYGLAFGVLSVSAAGFTAMLWLAVAIWAAGLGLWVVALVHAARGERWRMPLAARIADRLAGISRAS